MNERSRHNEKSKPARALMPLGLAILLVIILAFGAVGLFGAIIFLLLNGAQQLGLPTVVYLAIFVVISAIFAWLLQRLTSITLDISRFWFSEESDDRL